MIEIGKYNNLNILRKTSVGLFLGNEKEDVLLPNKYVPNTYIIGEELTVFVYLDHEERLVATTLKPYVTCNDFAFLRVNYVNNIGAFMDWGLEKDIFVPFKEQARPMEQGKRYLIYLYLDHKTNRLVASSKTNQFLSNDKILVKNNDEVDLIVSHTTVLGVNVIINKKHKGLLYKDDIYETIRTGDKLKGFIKNIRTDHKIDVSLRKQGFENVELERQKVLDEIKANRGFLRLNDHSHPEDIKTVLKMSKKSFKKVIGVLLKQRVIEIKEDGIYLVKES